MDKKYIGVAQTVIRTSDIKKIGNLICDELNCGDVVIKVSKTCAQETYQVIQKSSDKLAFCYVDDEKAIIVKYEKTEGVWAWKSSHETSISNEFTPEEQANLKAIADKIEIDEDGFISIYGGDDTYITIGDDEFYFYDSNENKVVIDGRGIHRVSPQALVGLTHSFNELDATLQGIIEDAIDDGGQNGVACSEAQWAVIKLLLDNSLFLNYGGWNLIKSVNDGIQYYIFGMADTDNLGVFVELSYNAGEEILLARYTEV